MPDCGKRDTARFRQRVVRDNWLTFRCRGVPYNQIPVTFGEVKTCYRKLEIPGLECSDTQSVAGNWPRFGTGSRILARRTRLHCIYMRVENLRGSIGAGCNQSDGSRTRTGEDRLYWGRPQGTLATANSYRRWVGVDGGHHGGAITDSWPRDFHSIPSQR
jgi:hypothetical protein